MKLKVCLIGSSESGKSSLTRTLLSQRPQMGSPGDENSGTEPTPPYYPTKATRIIPLTIKTHVVGTNNKNREELEVQVQLWEIGGEHKYKTIWPAVERDSDGVLICYDTHKDGHVRDASALHMHFVTHSQTGMQPNQCLIVGNNFRGLSELGPQSILGVSKRVRHVVANIEDEMGLVKEEFESFVGTLAQIRKEKDREKNNFK